MITISDGILTIPEDERFVGFIGDNLHTQKKFFIRSTPESGWLYRLYLTFDDGRHNFFTLTKEEVEEGTFLVWNIEEGQIFKSGLVKAQIKAFSDDSEVYHTTSDVFVAGKATEEDEEFLNSNSEFLGFEKRLNELYDKMDTATAKMPYVGTNGNWFTYDVNSGTYKDSGVSAMVSLDGVKITPENLDRDYWQKNSVIPAHGYDYFDAILNQSNAGNTITRVEFSGLSPVKSVVGKGSFIAVTSADLTYLLLFNLFNGESWRYDAGSNTLVNCGNTVVDLGVFVCWGDSENKGIIHTEFEEDVLYRFKLEGDFSECIGDNYCLGVYDAEDDSLRFINLLTGKYGRLSIDGHICSENENVDSVLSETSDNPVQNKVITKALKGKLNIVSITLPSGSNGDEELAEYLALAGTGYVGTVGGGKSFPFIFESYTAPNGIEVVEGLQAHVIQYKTYLKGPDAYKRYKRTYAHDGAEPIWSEWELDVDNLAQKVEDIEARLDGVELVSWKSVQDIVRAGRAAEIFSVGDRLVCEHSEYGLLEWTVIGVDQDTPTDESLSHSLTLQLENAIPAVQFDAPEALFCINSALSAGAPYTFTANSTTLNFTPTVAVPAGAVAVFPYFDYTNITDTPLTIYETPADTEPLLTLSVNSGTLGSSLNATYNNVNRARYGSSNWMQSAIRQFLNSEAEAGSVWLPKNNYDRPPKWVNNTAGFLNGMDEDFLSVIGNVQKPTFVTPLDNGPAVFENTEKFFLPAVTEVFGSDYRTCELSEGESYTYYKVNSSNTSNSISADKNRIVYYNGEIAFCLLRSPHYQEEQKYQYRTCNINKKGGIDSIYSCHDFSSNDPNVVIKPCCCIV
ncbi:MAG: hypothetical protein IKK10_02925 [Clostridia bacterium]|nr:hypothetical protein [Clostridia bacterium]